MSSKPADFRSIRVKRLSDTILIPLPREAWLPCGICHCPHCKGTYAFWDTLAVSAKPHPDDHRDTTWMVHAPEAHPLSVREAYGRRA